ncbi:MAG TPA: hypothetical protein VFE24_01525, partial [Pirellulales bacterium]|nr:hypothetical protein [Pirellulales bacterium]
MDTSGEFDSARSGSSTSDAVSFTSPMRRRWPRFSLASLFVLMTLVALGVWKLQQCQDILDECDAIEWFKANGFYPYFGNETSLLGPTQDQRVPGPPSWFLSLIGKSDFCHVRLLCIDFFPDDNSFHSNWMKDPFNTN